MAATEEEEELIFNFIYYRERKREEREREREGREMTSRSGQGSSGGGSSRTRVGKYELGRTLGEGNFAKVKFARHVETRENVAIKILDKEKLLKHKMIAQVISFLFFRSFYYY